MPKGLIHVRIPEEQDLFLENLAKLLNINKSDIVREALNNWTNHLQRLEEIGVVRAE